MTRPSFALRRFLHDKLVDRLTEEKVVDKRTIDDLANKWHAAELELGLEKIDHELARQAFAEADDAYDALTARLARHDAWIRRAKAFLHGLAIDDQELDSLIYMAPDVGEGEG